MQIRFVVNTTYLYISTLSTKDFSLHIYLSKLFFPNIAKPQMGDDVVKKFI